MRAQPGLDEVTRLLCRAAPYLERLEPGDQRHKAKP